MPQLCPCDSIVEYSLCCHPYMSGEKVAPDPEHLMRSRYYAPVMRDTDYLIKTWHPSCRAATLRAELIAGFAYAEWLGLTILEHYWQDDGSIGFVSFVARFVEDGKTGAIIERLRFLEENSQWYYIDGTRPQFGCDDPCLRDSGKKFKEYYGQQWLTVQFNKHPQQGFSSNAFTPT